MNERQSDGVEGANAVNRRLHNDRLVYNVQQHGLQIVIRRY